MVLNCAAIPEGLLESEIFGHEKGAFTDAEQAKPGKAELADGGTLFLDEISEIPYNLQAKLLRFLQDRNLERVGSLAPRPVDVRIIAATNRNLDQMLTAGEFREDLYYRINVFNIYLPPLRERSEDIPALVKHFLTGLSGGLLISSEAMEMLMAYKWPGNVRELENVIKSAAVVSDDKVIKPDSLPAHIAAGDNLQVGAFNASDNGTSLDDYLQNLEKNIIVRTLHHTGGVQVKAAELLGITQRSLWHRVKKYQIDVSEFKKSD